MSCSRFTQFLLFFAKAVLCWQLLLPTAHANTETATNTVTDAAAEPVKNSISTVAPAATGNAIQQFVFAEFNQKKQMLNNWPGSVEEFDTLVELINNDELYQDNSNNVYILKNDEQLFSYPDNKELTDWPSSLNQVTLNNALKSTLTFGQAKTKLSAESVSKRLEAVGILSNNIDAVDKSLITTQLATESNVKVKDALNQLKARMDFKSDDLATKLAAVGVLKDSNEPIVLSEVNNALAQDGLDPQLQTALAGAQKQIQNRIRVSEWTGHLFSGVSTASILLLAALGLAITYGLLGVINMAHGELIMIGAYTTYVVQGFFKTHFADMIDWYLILAIPSAFLVSAIVGMIIERIVIRPLYGRQLETLLATFGVSLILMQLVRMIFGAQNVEVSGISWLSGAYQITPSLSLPYNRIAIIGFTIIILLSLVALINKTRFGLFVRAVTQNRQMARAVGIRSSRIDMMAFGLGSGLAGLAGCALAQVGNVGPDLGQNYIIDAFLVVVVGGVGQILGAVLAALGLGISGTFLEVGIGAVLAKIVLLVLVILFIQKRPQGLFALKGRFLE